MAVTFIPGFGEAAGANGASVQSPYPLIGYAWSRDGSKLYGLQVSKVLSDDDAFKSFKEKYPDAERLHPAIIATAPVGSDESEPSVVAYRVAVGDKKMDMLTDLLNFFTAEVDKEKSMRTPDLGGLQRRGKTLAFDTKRRAKQ